MDISDKILTAFPGVWSIPEYQQDFSPTKWKKADPSHFAAWFPAQPVATHDLFVPCEGDSRWGKIDRVFFREVFFNKNGAVVKEEDPEGLKKRVRLKQKYVICLDPKSPFAGNVYRNDSKLLIYVKLFESVFFRPIHTVGYTLYNLTLVHAAVLIIEGLINKRPANETLQKVVCSLADIIRTPIYGTAILIVSIAGLLSAPFHPVLIYDFRAVIARLNRELGWGEKYGSHDYMCCFQPHWNIMELDLNDQPTDREDIAYQDRTNPVLVALDNKI